MVDSEIDEIIKRTCIDKSHKKFYDYKGCFLSNDFKDFAQEFENFEVNDSDIFVTSFPKAGMFFSLFLLL